MRILIITAAVALVACSSGSPTAPGAGGTTPPVQTNTITITAQGASPRNITINQGTRVLFINNDTRAHDMTSDPHPSHTDCPEINAVGLLQPTERRETGNLNTVRTCGFHDHINPGTANLRGSITIRAVTGQ